MRGFLAALAMIALLFGASGAAGAAANKQVRHPAAQAEVHTHTASGRGSGSHRATSTSPAFRAEEIVPDICKGCSSRSDVNLIAPEE